ncbi:hypothetical protein AAC387_Pa06g1509 [Persea americana]
MAASVMSSLSLKPSPFLEKSATRGIPSLARPSSSFKVEASAKKKIKTATPYVSSCMHGRMLRFSPRIVDSSTRV